MVEKKKKLDMKVQWVKFVAVLILYLLFLYWVKSWWGLLVVPFIYDVYITKKIKWQWWKEAERPVKFIMSWVDDLVFALVAVYFINQFFFQNYVIPSSSLEKSLLTGDYLFVSKVSYGPRIPQTPLTMPLTQHTLPLVECKSYIEWPHWDYRRVKGLGKVQLNDIVVFNFPAGDTLCSSPKWQAQDYYQLCYGIAYQIYPNRPNPDSMTPEERMRYFETLYETGRYELWHNRGEYDIYLENGFKAKWNLENDKIWAINPNSFEEVGCIHTAQGLEFDYIGVLIGNDLRFDKAVGKIITDRTKISKDDKSSGIRSAKEDVAERLIKNTYKTLLTRGQKGCFIYCEDKALANYIRSFLVSYDVTEPLSKVAERDRKNRLF